MSDSALSLRDAAAATFEADQALVSKPIVLDAEFKYEDLTVTSIKIPRELWAKFKRKCDDHHWSMSKALSWLIAQFLGGRLSGWAPQINVAIVAPKVVPKTIRPLTDIYCKKRQNRVPLKYCVESKCSAWDQGAEICIAGTRTYRAAHRGAET